MAEGKLAGKKVLMAIPHTQFRDEEFFEPKAILESEGAAVTGGILCGADVPRDAGRFCAIHSDNRRLQSRRLRCSGHLRWSFRTRPLLERQETRGTRNGLLRRRQGLAAISLSTVVLAKAKLLAGKKATVYFLPQAIQELKTGGAIYVTDPIVVQERLILAEGPTESARFGKAISAALAG
jgi:putative intracellular protease/amidase